MNSWSRNRKRIILAIVLFSAFILFGVPLFFLFYNSPTCSDSVMNGDETGVDCGGSCQRLCVIESFPIISKGDPRVISLGESAYEVVALFENPNTDAGIYRAPYQIRIYGPQGGLPVKTIEGSAFVPSGEKFAVFEGPFPIESGVRPSRASLSWEDSAFEWDKSISGKPPIALGNASLSRIESSPRYEVSVKNISLEELSNVDLTAVIYDEAGNIFAASKTFVESVAPGEEATAIFSWPVPFEGRPVEIEVLTRLFPDKSFLR